MQPDLPLTVEKLGLPSQTLAGHVAVVTGSGGGIGKETARALAWLGAAVVIAELSETGRETEQIICQAGGRALFVQTDVSSPESVLNLARKTETAFGPASILVNNAILSPVASVLEMEVELWDRVMAVNLRGTFLTCKAFLPAMLARAQGVVVNMVSMDAMPYISAYIASKQGIAAFSQSLAAESAGKGVQVIAFAPGFVDTPGLRSSGEGLAPCLGFTPEQFLGLSFHAAYTRAMPAQYAGAAAAYLVAALAGEYHGEITDGYTILERAGYLAKTASVVAQPAAAVQAGPASGRAAFLADGLVHILEQTAAEFEKLPVFARPLARGGFKRKAGLSLQDWARLAGQMQERFKRELPSRGPDPFLDQFKSRLGKLAVYYQGVPEETARFTKDAALLAQVNQLTQERLALINELARLI